MIIERRHLWALLGFALLLRLLSLATYPLMDTTEARYGEMARLMVETGNWLTPQFDYNIPFWGKPPLFTWMSALGIELFGLHEFAVRAPHWLAGVLTIVLVFMLAKRSRLDPLVAALVLATCAIFSIAAGAVMTDMALTLSLTIAMIGFYLCWLQKSHALLWGYFGFIGLGIGLLAKGPIVVVLMGMAVMPWLMLQHGVIGAFKVLWCRFPMVTGTCLMLGIAVPWYLMAEQATPGFLDYFIIGEHFKRFVVSGWEGDLYGSAHERTRGMIWVYWLLSALPWSLVLSVIAWRRKALVRRIETEHHGLFSFLLMWMLAPMLVFTLAGNILPAYVLPGVPALALLIAMLVTKKDLNWLSATATVVPVLLLGAALLLNLGHSDSRSDRVIHAMIEQDAPVFYVGKRPFSGQFYSQGQAKRIAKAEKLVELTDLPRFHLIGRSRDVEPMIKANALNCTNKYISASKRSLYLCSAG